jgi:asparagine synthase (glutamine-hydrolysing)
MCGFAGYLGGNSEKLFGGGVSRNILRGMLNAILRRGPDDEGFWWAESDLIALGHRRLSILDISSSGHQPMISASGRYVIIFNGEIYNHLELRREINSLNASFNWIGHSDTETLLAGIEEWGLEEFLQRAVGMFALALWDVEEKVLFLARDRVGEKPLYFGWQGRGVSQSFLFFVDLTH